MQQHKWLFCTKRKSTAALRLFCFPFAGSGASVFASWMKMSPADIEVSAIQLPGREWRIREPVVSNLHALADPLAHEILPYVKSPYAFFGHSMGATLAFEVGRRLKRMGGQAPQMFVASACRAPQLASGNLKMSNLSDLDFIENLRSMETTSPEVLDSQELMEVLMAVLRADFEAFETYEYSNGEGLGCPILAIAGSHDSSVSQEELNAWRVQSNGNFTLCIIPGHHLFLLTSPSEVMRAVTNHIRKNF